MNFTAIKQSADFGERTFSVLFGLQFEAFDRLQKLTQINLTTLKATFDDGQHAWSSWQFGPTSIAAVADLSAQFVKRTLSYTQQVDTIDGQFLTALTQAREVLHGQYHAIWGQLAANLGQAASLGSDAVDDVVRSATAATLRCEASMQESVRQAIAASDRIDKPASEIA
jgi:hypothetical protein